MCYCPAERVTDVPDCLETDTPIRFVIVQPPWAFSVKPAESSFDSGETLEQFLLGDVPVLYGFLGESAHLLDGLDRRLGLVFPSVDQPRGQNLSRSSQSRESVNDNWRL